MRNKLAPTLLKKLNYIFLRKHYLPTHTILSGLTYIVVTDANTELHRYLSYAAYLQFMHLTKEHQNNCLVYSEEDLGFKWLPILSMFLADNFT